MSRVRIKGPSTNGQNLRGLNKRIGQMTQASAIAVASTGAPVITGQARATHNSGQTCYGTARPLGTHGNALSLYLTGKTVALLKFVSDGTTRIRAALPEKYMRFLVGKFAILPNGNAAMPQRWRQELRYVAIARCRELAEKAFRGFG